MCSEVAAKALKEVAEAQLVLAQVQAERDELLKKNAELELEMQRLRSRTKNADETVVGVQCSAVQVLLCTCVALRVCCFACCVVLCDHGV